MLDDGQLVQGGGAALAVAQLLNHGDRLAQEPARLGRVALIVLDDGQLVQGGGAALAVAQLLSTAIDSRRSLRASAGLP